MRLFETTNDVYAQGMYSPNFDVSQNHQESVITEKVYIAIRDLSKLLCARNIQIENGKTSFLRKKKKLIADIDISFELEELATGLYSQYITNANAGKLYLPFITAFSILQMYSLYKYRHISNDKTKRLQRLFETTSQPFLLIVDTWGRTLARINNSIIVFLILPSIILFYIGISTPSFTTVQVKQ